MRTKRNPIEALVVALATLLVGCGYHMAASGEALPPTANTIYVERFSNRSRIVGLSEDFDRHLKDEIATHKRLDLVDDPASADLVLSGIIGGQDNAPSAFNAVAEPTAAYYNLSVAATLIDNHDKKVIWSTNGITRTNNFGLVAQSVVVTSPEFLQQNLRSNNINNLPDAQLAATQRGSTKDLSMDQLARDLYASMSEGF
jgi:hypothetical protein